MTVALVAEHRHLQDVAVLDAQAAWSALGCKVELVVPDAHTPYEIPAARPTWSVVVSRGRHLAGLGLLSAASALGVLAVNNPAAVEMVRNKVAMQAVLADHGLPLPRTWFAGDVRALSDLPADVFPLVVKPFDGDGARGLVLVTDPAQLAGTEVEPSDRTLYLAQQFLPTDGYDLKLYGVGSRVWGVRKASPVVFAGPGPARPAPTAPGSELVELDAELTDIALTCGRACRLELWGVDVALTPLGPVVIEVNDFPTYSAVPDAGRVIAEHVLTLVEMRAVAEATGRGPYGSIVRAPR